MSVGAISSTLGSWLIPSPSDSCITALENAKKIDEFGGCTRMSAPTPSTRLPHSAITPDVSPTIIRIRTTWMAMAMMLRKQRNGRAEMLPQNICNSEKGPSYVSAMECRQKCITRKTSGQNLGGEVERSCSTNISEVH